MRDGDALDRSWRHPRKPILWIEIIDFINQDLAWEENKKRALRPTINHSWWRRRWCGEIEHTQNRFRVHVQHAFVGRDLKRGSFVKEGPVHWSKPRIAYVDAWIAKIVKCLRRMKHKKYIVRSSIWAVINACNTWKSSRLSGILKDF